MRRKKTSWKTTFFGALAGLASIAAMVPERHCQAIAPLVSAASLVMLGKSARDNKVSSEDVGAASQSIPVFHK